MSEQPKSWVSPYYPSFNGFRGIAVLLVFLVHYGPTLRPWAIFDTFWVGVDLFFVLSGFLITGILYDTVDEPRFFRDFYVRRALRIFPLYWGIFLIALISGRLLSGGRISPPILFFAGYIGNLVTPFLDTAKTSTWQVTVHGRPFILAIGHFWSLCIEEQFYLVWPWIVFHLRDRKRLMRFSLWAIGSTVALRCVALLFVPRHLLMEGLLYNVTCFRCDGLFVGAWCALWLRDTRLTGAKLQRLCYTWGATSCLLLAAGLALTPAHATLLFVNPFIQSIGYTLIAVCAASLLLLSLDQKSWVHRAARNRWLSSLGAVSYGFYVFHGIPILPVRSYILRSLKPHHLGWLGMVVFFVGLYGLAQLSFRFYEAPFLRLKQRLAPSAHSGPPIEALSEDQVPTM